MANPSIKFGYQVSWLFQAKGHAIEHLADQTLHGVKTFLAHVEASGYDVYINTELYTMLPGFGIALTSNMKPADQGAVSTSVPTSMLMAFASTDPGIAKLEQRIANLEQRLNVLEKAKVGVSPGFPAVI